MPLDVLPDLPAFRDLLVAYVKSGWRDSHPDRERLPKGFAHGLKFDLVGIEDGSAVPAVQWDTTDAQLQLPEFIDEMQELVAAAFKKVVVLIASSASPDPHADLTSEEIRALNKFGAGLELDERIEVVGEKTPSGEIIFLDKVRRANLLRRASNSYEVRFDSVGKLLGSRVDEDERSGSIEINTEEHGSLLLRMPPDRVKEEFDGKIGSDVQFRLMVVLDRSDKLLSVAEVLEIDLIDDAQLVADLERCRDRINALRALANGWHDGAGEAPSQQAIAAAYRLLGSNPRLAKLYRIFPTDSGGVLFEFVQNGWDCSIEIDSDGNAEIIALQSNGPAELEYGPLSITSDDFRAKLEEIVGDRDE